jgi:hypothetical protein
LVGDFLWAWLKAKFVFIFSGLEGEIWKNINPMTKDLRRTLINGFGLLPRRHIEFLFLSAFLPTALSLPLS